MSSPARGPRDTLPGMFWKLLGRADVLERGEAARRAHSAWLTHALASGRAYPRIPVRRVDEGGFAVLMQTQYGRQVAEAWWTLALEQVEDSRAGSSHRR